MSILSLSKLNSQSIKGHPSLNGLLSLGVICALSLSSLALSACNTGQKETKATPEDAPYKVTLKQVEQHHKIGSKLADGQYVVLLVDIANLKTEPTKIPGADLTLETVNQDPKEHYTLPPENSVTFDFAKVYGRDKLDRLASGGDIKLNPKSNVERYIIFSLPDNVAVTDYQLFLKSFNVKVPLNNTAVELHDYRQEEDQPTQQN